MTEENMTEEERLKAMSARVEAARKKILEEREAVRKSAKKLTLQLLQGVDYTEEVVVRLINGEYYILEIHPLAEGEIIEAFQSIPREKLEKMNQQGGNTSFTMDDYDFFWTLVALSSRFPKDDLKKKLVLGESAVIAQKILEISGFLQESGVESFPQK